MVELEEVVIVDFLRTPMSRSSPSKPERDVFRDYRADVMLGMVIKEIVKRNSLDAKLIDDMITGCAFQVGPNWTYGGRNPLFYAELPYTVPAISIDRQCASGMSSIHIGAMEIMTGNSDVVLACGMEHMTNVSMGSNNPYVVRDESVKDYVNFPQYAKYEMEIGWSMIQTAQNIHEISGITRKKMDEWAKGSQDKAVKALDDGFFKGELLPIEGFLPDGSKKMIETDQSIRANIDLEKMGTLRPVSIPIRENETANITAGNASPMNSGAAACLIMSRKMADQLGLKPLARIVSMSWAGVKPSVMGTGPIPASIKALKKASLNVDDIDCWEINEAFAIVAANAARELEIPDPYNKINAKGGAIALGHALGITGVRLVGTLARILQKENKRYGLATPCVGGGQGTATIIEKI